MAKKKTFDIEALWQVERLGAPSLSPDGAQVVASLTDQVYLTIDVDGLDPAIMPATGTPEPGGLSWHETVALLRAVMSKRHVVACDVVELCPMPGLAAPNFLCAKLVYKILSYRFAKIG